MRTFKTLVSTVTVALAGVGGYFGADVSAATLQVQNGLTVGGDPYAGTESGWVHSGAPNTVVSQQLTRVGFADDAPDQVYRSLVRFGALSHWAGITPAELGFTSTDITGARIKLFKRDGQGSGLAELHVLDSADQNWTESFTNWNNRRTDIPEAWSQGPGIGGAYGPLVDTAKPFSDADAVGTMMTFELTGNAAALNIVKDWVDGDNTSGTFFLRATTEGGSGNHYNSWYTEQSTSISNSLRPMLEIDYVPEPASMLAISALGGLMMLRRRK